jgi:small GTP-binding protein
LRDGQQIIDDPVVVQVDSRTIDLSLHGGVWVVEKVIELAKKEGFVAGPLLFPEDIESEVERDLPYALTSQTIGLLLSQPDAWRHMIARHDTLQMRKALQDRCLETLLNPPVVAIVGAPNVGKSTLANRLFGQQRSITADLPGTTRDWVGEQVNLNGLVITLVDTPGWRQTDDPIEAQAIQQSGRIVGQASLILEVLDATQPPIRRFPQAHYVILNKCDEVVRLDNVDSSYIRISAKTGEGLSDLIHTILTHFDCEDLTGTYARCWTNRQRAYLKTLLARDQA